MKKGPSTLWCKSEKNLPITFRKREKEMILGKRVLQNSGSAQRLSGASHRENISGQD